MVVGHASRKPQLELLVELRGPGEPGQGFCGGWAPPGCPSPSATCSPSAVSAPCLGSPISAPEPAPPSPLPCPSHPHRIPASLPCPRVPPSRILVVVDHRCEGLAGELAAAGLTKDDLRGWWHEGPAGDAPTARLPLAGTPLTGRAWLGSSPAMYWTRTARLRTEPWRLLKLRLCGYTNSRFLRGRGRIRAAGPWNQPCLGRGRASGHAAGTLRLGEGRGWALGGRREWQRVADRRAPSEHRGGLWGHEGARRGGGQGRDGCSGPWLQEGDPGGQRSGPSTLTWFKGRIVLPPGEATRVMWPVSQVGKLRPESAVGAGLQPEFCLPLPGATLCQPHPPSGPQFICTMRASSLCTEPS